MTETPRTSTLTLILKSIRPALFFTAFLLLAGIGLRLSAAENTRLIPAPAADEVAGQATSEVAILAGGCFWGAKCHRPRPVSCGLRYLRRAERRTEI
jgi:hypothetical protein